MRILILGGSGMLGHRLWLSLSRQHKTWASLRTPISGFERLGLDPSRACYGVDARCIESVLQVLAEVRPDVVVNCIGVIKQLRAAKDPRQCIEINALFPHRLHLACQSCGARLIHISTDCVFSGRTGNYMEVDVSDAEDLYGRTKYLGEVQGPGAVTLRTSIVGREFQGCAGLFEWFLGQRGKKVEGFAKAIYTGFTTQVLSDIIAMVIEKHVELEGVWQVSSEPISKYDLLMRLNKRMGLGIEIERDETFVCDRSLNSARFQEATGWRPPSWDAMLDEFVKDQIPYEEIRKTHVD